MTRADNARPIARPSAINRRQFLTTGALAGAALLTGAPTRAASPSVGRASRPNVLFITTDQQGLDTLSAYGCRDVATPNLDRLARSGVSFMESYTANPLCSPARSSWFTGRMPSETGVITNGIPIRSDVPNLGQWLGEQGYETIYTGKWHMPGSFTSDIPGFKVIPTGIGGQGNMGDAAVSRACEGYLRNRSRTSPFFLAASLLQPHDICQWVSMHWNAADELPYPEIADRLPPLPPNFAFDPSREPRKVANFRRPSWSERQWRYYLWSYYRHVEMVDAEIGRILRALEDSGEAANTLIVLTSDHGEGRGRHHMTLKNYLYDEAAKVPLIVAWPGKMLANKQDRRTLVSGVDIVPTICDYAGVKSPPKMRGLSLRPSLEGDRPMPRLFVAAEVTVNGRMVRSPNYKYIAYKGDPVEQLFDMAADSGETKNVASEPKYAGALAEHRKLLEQWEAQLDVAAT